jgi:hypothetical protein
MVGGLIGGSPLMTATTVGCEIKANTMEIFSRVDKEKRRLNAQELVLNNLIIKFFW